MRFGFGVAISLMVWLAVCFYWVETLYTRLDGLHAAVMPAGAIGSLVPMLFPATTCSPTPPRRLRVPTSSWRCSPTACSPWPPCTRC